ncbi:MAG: CHAT domain-containing protein [Thiofilum sp.]|uniref:CHAT domain-containing protein n=1 Tax=Thiofilum sp. TaxID=2212733 RepID=UPI0025EACC77|nr:CHAT domain-containing protein [Thiofilum sp.]MBK8452252.1 CHAT domain-containing protein [Thiofilum sp.]
MDSNSWMASLWQRISQWWQPKTIQLPPIIPPEAPATHPSASVVPMLEPASNEPSAPVVPSIQPVELEPVISTPTLTPVTHTIDAKLLPTLRAELCVRLGSLTASRYPVTVGHYHQDAIRGAEQVLDQALKGQLSQWQQLGIYAGTVGTSTLVIDRNLQPQGALVLGLGAAGQLHPNKLATAYTQGLLRYTRHPEALQNADKNWQLSTLLIGAQAPTLTLEQVLSSLLIGIRGASQRLQEQALPYRFSLDIIEIDAWRALEASDVLFELVKQDEYSTEFVLTEYLQQLPSTLPVTKPQSTNQGWWSRWNVSASNLPRQPSKTEYLLPTLDLLPTSARAQWLSGSHIILQVDQNTLGVRWELLQEPNSLPLGLQVAVVRQLAEAVSSESVNRAKGLLAIGVDQAPRWQEVLPPSWMHDWLNPEQAEKIFCALHTGDHSMLHWVGSVSGTAQDPYLIMANEQVLTVSDIAQIRHAPSLIVLELTNETADLELLAPHLISAWFKAGAQTLIINRQKLAMSSSTLWLRSFYQSVVNGESVGNAVFEARKAVWSVEQTGNEWVGFECYGEPSLVLTKAAE